MPDWLMEWALIVCCTAVCIGVLALFIMWGFAFSEWKHKRRMRKMNDKRR